MEVIKDTIMHNSLVGFEIEIEHHLAANLFSVPTFFFNISGWKDGPQEQTKYKHYILKKEYRDKLDYFSDYDMSLIDKHLYRCFVIKSDDDYILRLRRRGNIIENKYKSIEAAIFFADHISFG